MQTNTFNKETLEIINDHVKNGSNITIEDINECSYDFNNIKSLRFNNLPILEIISEDDHIFFDTTKIIYIEINHN